MVSNNSWGKVFCLGLQNAQLFSQNSEINSGVGCVLFQVSKLINDIQDQQIKILLVFYHCAKIV